LTVFICVHLWLCFQKLNLHQNQDTPRIRPSQPLPPSRSPLRRAKEGRRSRLCGDLERDPRYAGTQTGVHPIRCKHKCIVFYRRKGRYPAGKSALDPPKSIKGKKNDKKLYLPAGFDMLMPGTK
jgi:hypothetical protein